MEKEYEQKSKELKEIQDQIKNLTTEIDTLNSSYKEAEFTITKSQMDTKSLSVQLETLQKQEKDLAFFFFSIILSFLKNFFKKNYRITEDNSASEDDVERMKELEKTIKKNNQELEKLNESTKVFEESIKSLQAKIMEIGGMKLKAQKAKVDGISEAIDLANEKITRWQV